MRSNSLIYIGLFALSAAAFAAPGTRLGASSGQIQVDVSTHRSDGAIFPAVVQSQRFQKRRNVRVSSSTQALPNRLRQSPNEEPVAGARFTTGASGDELRPDAGSLSHQPLFPVVVIDPLRARKPKR